MRNHVWQPSRSFYNYLETIGSDDVINVLPQKEAYLMAIDHLFPAKVIQAATVAIQGGRSRVQMVRRRYHLRSFENVLVDSHESRVYSPEHARVANLFAYHLDLSVTFTSLIALIGCEDFFKTGSTTLQNT